MKFETKIKILLAIYIIFLISLVNYGMIEDSDEISIICKDSMIKYRSCDDLELAKDFCVDADIYYWMLNCSLTENENVRSVYLSVVKE